MTEPAPEPIVEPAIIVEPLPVEGTCATLRVTNVVHGTAPAGTTFTVIVECSSTDEAIRSQQLPQGQVPPFTTVLTFPETGGTQDVLIAGLSSCSVSEAPPPPPCTPAGITPETTQTSAPNQVFPVFVTNNCEAPPAPVSIQGTIVVNEAPAPVVVSTPRFTG